MLEHSDPSVLAGLLALADLDGPPLDGAEFRHPAPDGPPGFGEIRSPHRRLLLAAVAPGEEREAGFPEGLPALVINLTGKAPEGVKALSWERVDRWLAGTAERYDAESRTGFLLRQFRAYLPEVGISYFAGFDRGQLESAPQSFAALSRFYQQAQDLFERLEGVLPEGLTEVRRARPEDLLAGYCYRDYASAGLGAENFLRVALHLGPGELQIACWFGPLGEAHTRFRTALLTADSLTPLRAMEPPPLLWLWSPGGEERISLDDLGPARAAAIDWDAYTVAVQVSRPFTDLAGEGLTRRIGTWVSELLEPLESVLTGTVH